MNWHETSPRRHRIPRSQERAIWRAITIADRPLRTEIQERRKQLRLAGTETFDHLKTLHGEDLLQTESVRLMLAYSSDWGKFTVNTEPRVTPDIPGWFSDRASSTIYLPYPFTTSSIKNGEHDQWGETQFYWDCYFTGKALAASGKPEYVQLAINQVENFQYLFDRLGYIPNGSKLSIINRSQTPFLSGMIRDIYAATGDKEWFSQKIELAKREYRDFWMITEQQAKDRGISHPVHRISEDSLLLHHTGLDSDKIHYDASADSGMDDSAEWARRAPETASILLNCAMYKYEKDFAEAARELGNFEEAAEWEKVAAKRQEEMNTKMWDEKVGRYCNLQYNRKTKKWERDIVHKGLTSFMPLWVEMASAEQAKRMVKYLPEFESPYGLFISTRDSVISEVEAGGRSRIATIGRSTVRRFQGAVYDSMKPQQWDYPNIWAPMEYFTFEGLLNYGYTKDAKRIIETSLRANAAFFQERGTFSEKMDGTTGYDGKSYFYGNQEGFGWRCAVNLIAAGRLMDIEDGKFGTITA